MEADEVVGLLDVLERAGIEVWLDGGWGVDALLGEQRRAHDDLDLVAELRDVDRLQEALAAEGYVLLGGGPPSSFELVDEEGRQVDVHPVVFDEGGDGMYRMQSGGDWIYPAAGFAGTGTVGGRVVRCLTPDVQILSRVGYELSDKDHAEIRALRDRFGIAGGG